MAWQTPKTDWAVSDGVRDTDFNRIEGNILELYNGASQRQNVTIYVNASGNDTTGEGTYAAPFATIGKALSAVPKNLGGVTATIDVAPGTYAGNLDITGFHGGTLYITCTGNITINGSINISNSNFVRIYAYRVTVTGSISVTRGSVLYCEAPITCTGSTQYAIRADYGSRCILNDTITCSNKTNAAIYALASEVNMLDISISTSAVGLYATRGGSITYRGATNNATAQFVTEQGGRIYAGSQESAPGF